MESRQCFRRFDSMPIVKSSLYRAFLACDTESQLCALLSDLMSEPEIIRIKQRWEIAEAQIANPCSKREARRRHVASQELVDRVFAALANPRSGYRLAYRRQHRYLPKRTR
jgi:uncharacterized protein YerC